MKYLGLDYGQSKVGMAVGDDETSVAVSKGTLKGLSQPKLVEKITAIVNLEDIDRIVIGLPLNLDGEETEITKEVKLFVEKLRSRTDTPVQTMDERYTSQMADNLLKEVKDKNQKQDQVAAQIILQNYFDKIKQ
ncbi:Holliday junction resolvase RuvX [Patescibacteria group bacterium]|nr:Holliday junction resolvase RuvX [Patescibacteria group bacterium]MBU1673666.1 Holliday junction resolvase RuvX [Patescibacteria group bacterium]MBU1963846.1 Holliday junction resolvase RuvX [Patescibacteria group bacterium]